MWRDQLQGGAPDIAVTPNGQKVIVDGSRNRTQDAIATYNPRGDMMFIGGNRTAAYSVADGTLRWITSGARGSGVIGLSGDGTRLFGTRWASSPGITTVAYQT